MHDFDRTRLEGDFDDEFESAFEADADFDEFDDDELELEADDDGFDDEFEFELELENALSGAAPVFSEDEEMELASELLEISDDEELEQFLGRALKRGFKKLKRKARRAFRGKFFRKLRGGLRGLARRGLGALGSTVGGMFGGPVGARLGSRLASGAGRAFGLELEGMSPEDQEFEVARRIVRMTGEAAQAAAAIPESVNDNRAAEVALRHASRRVAPSLAGSSGRRSRGASGRWVRRGRRIVLMGV